MTRDLASWGGRAALFLILLSLAGPSAVSGDAPAWMHVAANAPLPSHDERADAILLFSERILTVQANGRMKKTIREVYRILRPDGRHFGKLNINFDAETKITGLRAWCIPAQGKDYEVKEKDFSEAGYTAVSGGELYSDLRMKRIEIPASEVGNVVGYEIEREVRPFIFEDTWYFQESVPVLEAHYTLQLPTGWEYRATWLNHAEIAPMTLVANQYQWVVKDLPGLKHEPQMPPMLTFLGQLVLNILPPGGPNASNSFATWDQMGKWYTELWKGQQRSSPELQAKVAELTKQKTGKLEQMRALAGFMQDEIRYVAIELGIGGFQPHSANETFAHRYGDCKDKATLLSVMLGEIGVSAYPVIINVWRGFAGPGTPPKLGAFNHAILAISLPGDVDGPSLLAVIQHPQLGRLLIFDPTDGETPFGKIRGSLQGNYGLLVTSGGGELFALPILPPTQNGIQRRAHLTLDEHGVLKGEMKETLLGDDASHQRTTLNGVQKDTDKVKPIETLMASSMSSFQISKATVFSAQQRDLPLRFEWSFLSQDYAKSAANLLLVRPRVVGVKAEDVLESKEPRKYPVQFEGPRQDGDNFEIEIPAGYVVDDLPPPADAEYSFGSYHSKVVTEGNVIRYTRVYEIKELSVPLNKLDDLKKFYRIIASDERGTAVLKPASR